MLSTYELRTYDKRSQYLQQSQEVRELPLVSLPEFAMERRPVEECLSLLYSTCER